MFILGLDCGGTSSQALLTSRSGRVLGRGIGGPANYTVNGVEGVVSSVSQATAQALQHAELNLSNLLEQGVFLALGVSGASRGPELISLTRAFQQEGFDNVVVQHDASIALLGALSGTDGVAVIAGTGSIAYGLHQAKSSRIGGWGYLLGDEGSAFWIALQALQHIMWGHDGRASLDKELRDAACQYFEITGVEQLVPLVYKTPLNRGFIGGFSKTVTTLANSGNTLCQGILAQGGRHLGRLALAALVELGLADKQGRVGACGGVFAAGDWILTPMQEEIWLGAQKQTLTLPDFEPVVGAVLLGAKHLNLDVQNMVIELRRSL